MITALMVLVFGVILLGWLLAGVAYAGTLVALLARALDHSDTPGKNRAPKSGRWQASDDEFLRAMGIQLTELDSDVARKTLESGSRK